MEATYPPCTHDRLRKKHRRSVSSVAAWVCRPCDSVGRASIYLMWSTSASVTSDVQSGERGPQSWGSFPRLSGGFSRNGGVRQSMRARSLTNSVRIVRLTNRSEVAGNPPDQYGRQRPQRTGARGQERVTDHAAAGWPLWKGVVVDG